jgi:hypothetical protein
MQVENLGRVQARVQYVEAARIRVGTEVMVRQRRSAGALQGVRAPGREVKGAKVPMCLVECQWKILGDSCAGAAVQERKRGCAHAGSNLKHAVEQECGMRTPRVGVDVGRREGNSKGLLRLSIEN